MANKVIEINDLIGHLETIRKDYEKLLDKALTDSEKKLSISKSMESKDPKDKLQSVFLVMESIKRENFAIGAVEALTVLIDQLKAMPKSEEVDGNVK